MYGCSKSSFRILILLLYSFPCSWLLSLITLLMICWSSSGVLISRLHCVISRFTLHQFRYWCSLAVQICTQHSNWYFHSRAVFASSFHKCTKWIPIAGRSSMCPEFLFIFTSDLISNVFPFFQMRAKKKLAFKQAWKHCGKAINPSVVHQLNQQSLLTPYYQS